MAQCYTSIFGTLVGCSGCMITIESLASFDASSMHLMTFATFIAVTLDGLIRHKQFSKIRYIPYSAYIEIVLLFFAVSIASNQAYNFEIPFPLFIIFRSGTLLANVILTRLIQRRVYSWSKLSSVLVVTIGIAIFTMEERSVGHVLHKKVPPYWAQFVPLPTFAIGILLMSLCLFGSAYMGLAQEKLYFKHGKYPDEMMFYTHFLSLPLFAFVGESIISDVQKYTDSPNVWIADMLELPLPKQWFRLFLVIFMQLICIRNVYQLSSQMSSLNLTMILTLRKFLNLLLSFLLFNNPFTNKHLLAAGMKSNMKISSLLLFLTQICCFPDSGCNASSKISSPAQKCFSEQEMFVGKWLCQVRRRLKPIALQRTRGWPGLNSSFRCRERWIHYGENY
uniref:UDP-xylose and UDP-N-acetylglucosamine transporter n=1 Tax=Ditylenchus dipsaci TaxID=166011 RepID=A0A915E584_9BILA